VFADAMVRQLGRTLRGVRPGLEAVVGQRPPAARLPDVIDLRSTAFEDQGRLPARFTRDGKGCSPALAWKRAPAGSASYALLVEDADAPWFSPIVHALVVDIPLNVRSLAEGALPHFRDCAQPVDPSLKMGRNSYGAATWLPPGPVRGHGAHRYVFQIFALSKMVGFRGRPTRAALIDALGQWGCARGAIIGLYERT
jgi:hypothetical protein